MKATEDYPTLKIGFEKNMLCCYSFAFLFQLNSETKGYSESVTIQLWMYHTDTFKWMYANNLKEKNIFFYYIVIEKALPTTT